MSKRNLLRNQIISAWEKTIRESYAEMLINSERGLQLYFCMNLMEEFRQQKLTRRLFVEPTTLVKAGVKRSPDLLICNSRRVIGVVELKYTPRGLPKTTKDFETLNLLGRHDALTICNQRFRGPGTPKTYTVSNDALLCWLSIQADKPFHPDRTALSAFNTRYLELRAVTSSDGFKIVRGDSE